MTIDPKTAMMIFQGLMQATPAIKRAIPNLLNYTQGADITQFPNLVNAIKGGYDLPTMDANIADIGYWDWDDGGDPEWQKSLGHEVLSSANDKDYNPELIINTDEGRIDSLLAPSEAIGFNESNINDFSMEELTHMAPASMYAKSMQLHDPNTSPLQARELLRGDLSLNELINSKALDNAIGLGRHQTSNPQNEVFARNNPQTAIDSNYKVGQVLGILPFFGEPGYSYDNEQDVKKRMFKMLRKVMYK